MSTTRVRCGRTALTLALLGALSTAALATAGSASAETLAPPATAGTAPTTSLADVSALVGADTLHTSGLTGRGVDVALLDTGIAPVRGLDAPGKVVNGPDLSFESQSPSTAYLDGYGHGTHLAGIVAGPDGVAPGARLVNVRVGAANGAVDVSQIIAGIDWVVQHRHDGDLDIRVLNVAVGTDSRLAAVDDPLAKAVDNAWRHGIVVVTAVGNDGAEDHRVASPSTDPNVLAVGATDSAGSTDPADSTAAGFSARGSMRKPDLLAPGSRIASLRTPGSYLDVLYPQARRGDDLFRGSGTSQASAVVSGAAALLLQQRPDLTPDQVKQLLLSSSAPVAGSRSAGNQQLDVAAAAAATTPSQVQRLRTLGGTGSLEAARGTQHVVRDGVVLTGDRDIFGKPFDSSRWAADAAAASAWDGGTWNGSTWSGSSWSSSSWSSSSWSSSSWSGSSWSASSWSASSWSASSWSGSSWSSSSWSASSWSGSSWSASSWSGSSWSSSSWSGDQWA